MLTLVRQPEGSCFAPALSQFCSLAGAATSWAHCRAGDPAGRYDGRVVSAEAGPLEVILNLRCAGRKYAGVLITPVGRFAVTDGAFVSDVLHLSFESGGALGKLDLAVFGGISLQGSFSLQTDHGPVTLARIGKAVENDSFEPVMTLSPAEWREDLAYFARELPKRHANAFHRITKAKFEAAVAKLDAKIPRLNSDEIYVELDRLAIMIGDGHTYVMFPPDRGNLPLDVRKFQGGYRVVAAAREYERALGTTVIAIDRTPVSEAHDRLIEITPRDETQSLREGRVESFLTTGMMLHGTNIARTRDRVSYRLRRDDGSVFQVRVKAVAPGTHVNWKYIYARPPLYRRHERESLWCIAPKPAAVYCNFRGYDGLSSRAKAMLTLVHRLNPEKLIIDMRGNSGGDYTEGLKYVIQPIAPDIRLNRRGHLFVLIDEGVFSAGMSNSAQFRSLTHATLVGQPIGERPNTYQEAREMMLQFAFARQILDAALPFRGSGRERHQAGCVDRYFVGGL
jgi:hypothetical protein